MEYSHGWSSAGIGATEPVETGTFLLALAGRRSLLPEIRAEFERRLGSDTFYLTETEATLPDFYEDPALWTAQVPEDARAEPALAFVPGDPALPRVLLIGDSISMGYTVPVRERLRGAANVRRLPANGGPTERGLANLDAWLGQGDWAAIHFNFGLHDLKYLDPNGKLDLRGIQVCSLAQYERNLTALVPRLQASGARLIWAQTTPVPGGANGRRAGDEVAYNASAGRVMEKAGVPVNDLHAAVRPELARYQLPENVHFNEAGSDFLADRVAVHLRAALHASR